MKLLYVVNGRFPSERAYMIQIVHMCNAFASKGIKTTLLTTNRKTTVMSGPEDFYGQKFNFNVERSSVWDFAQFSPYFFKFLNQILYTVQRISFLYGIKAQQYDIIYGRDPFILYRLGKKFGFHRIVYESHEARYNQYVSYLVTEGVKIVVISEGIRDEYLKKGVPNSQILVAHDGIDESYFEKPQSKKVARDRLGIDTPMPVVMYIGGFDAWKGVDVFFEASNLNQRTQFVVIGGKKEQVEAYSTKYPNVLFLGERPYKELRDNQQAADILVIPNTAKNALSSSFTSPLKLFAHMASQVPLVVSDIPSMRVVLNDSQTTFFVPDDPEALSNVIDRVLNNVKLTEEKTQNAYNLSKKYTWGKRANSIVAFAFDGQDDNYGE